MYSWVPEVGAITPAAVKKYADIYHFQLFCPHFLKNCPPKSLALYCSSTPACIIKAPLCFLCQIEVLAVILTV